MSLGRWCRTSEFITGASAICVMSLGVAACANPTPTLPAPVIVAAPTPSGLAIEGVPASVSYGQSIQLTATASMPGGGRKQVPDIEWRSSNQSVATISPSGLLRITGFGDTNVVARSNEAEATAHITLPPPPPPAATLAVTIDEFGSTLGIAGASDIVFDMSQSTGFGLRYDLDFGDGSPHSGKPRSTHVYAGHELTEYAVRASVTDVLGRTDTVSTVVAVVSVATHSTQQSATWNDGEHFLRFTGQNGTRVEGDYWFPYVGLTGSLDARGGVHLMLNDGSIALDGQVVLKDQRRPDGGWHPDRHLLVTISGGPQHGRTVDLKWYQP